MSNPQKNPSILNLRALIAGCGMGVSVKSAEMLDTHFTTSVTKAMRSGEERRSVCSSIAILSNITLSYEAGYDIHLTTALTLPFPTLNHDGVGLGFEQFLEATAANDDMIIDVYHDSIDMKPYQQISMRITNEKAGDWLEEQNMAFADKDVAGDYYFFDESAKEILNEIQNHFGYGFAVREEREDYLSDNVISDIKREIKADVARVFALPPSSH